MAQTTIEQFATELKMPAGALIEQLAAAGVSAKKVGDNLTEQDKTRLLDYLRKQHGAAGEPKKRITLTRKQTSESKAPPAPEEAPAPVAEAAPVEAEIEVEIEAPAPAPAPAPVVAEAPPHAP